MVKSQDFVVTHYINIRELKDIVKLKNFKYFKRGHNKQKFILMNFFYFHSWKCAHYMLFLYNKDWFLLMHITYINFIWTNRRNSRFDHLSLKYTDQIRKQHCFIPLGFPHILLTTTTFFSFSSSVSNVFFFPLVSFFFETKYEIYIFRYTLDCAVG